MVEEVAGAQIHGCVFLVLYQLIVEAGHEEIGRRVGVVRQYSIVTDVQVGVQVDVC